MARRKAPKPPRGPGAGTVAALGTMTERINIRMRELGLSRKDVVQVVKNAGHGASTIYTILAGEQINPSFAILVTISEALNVPLAWLVGGSDRFPPGKQGEVAARVRVIGVADATAYREEMETSDGPHREVQGIPPKDERLAGAPRYGIEVRDNHLEGLTPPLTAGAIAHFVDITTLDLDVESGRIYLLYRKNDEGQVQMAFWRAMVFRDRVEFAPASRDLEYNRRKTFTMPRDELHKSEKVKIGGLFYAATLDYF